MKKTYIRRFWKFYQQLISPALAGHARKEGKNTFTRRRKMPLEDILLCCLAKKGLTAVMELLSYARRKGAAQMAISKQGYLKQRKNLNPEVFTYLNHCYLEDFYSSGEAGTWNGYLLLAADGSKAEIPNSAENKKTFGCARNQNTKEGVARALVSGLYDLINGFFISIQVSAVNTSENSMAKKNLLQLGEAGITQPVLVLFDRGYPSLEFINFLEKNGIHYIFRLASNDYAREREGMETEDGFVDIKHDRYRMRHIKKKHPESYREMEEKGSTRARVIKSQSPSGQETAMLTDLPAVFTSSQVTGLYFKRWGIETKYNTLKNKIKLESVTGNAPIYVYQDFYAQVLAYNMVQDIRRCADTSAGETGRQKGLKHPVKTNENIAIGLFKERMVKIILEGDHYRQALMLSQLQKDMEKHVVPEREVPGRERKKNKANKYCINQKYSF